jgi:hypothetical protein
MTCSIYCSLSRGHDGDHERTLAGAKADSGKPRYDLLPWAALARVVDVLTFGAKKYGDDNWRTVPNARARYLAAAFRHFVAYAKGETLDPESGLPHLAHAMCCLLFILDLET